MTVSQDRILLVYDRQCPVCEMYCTLSRIRAAEGELVLVDAREDSEVMREITASGLDIDQGMVLKIGERLYYGADAIHMLSLLGTRSGLFNRMTFWLFRSPRVATLLYPVLRFFRNLLLKMLGRSRINNLGTPGNSRF